jgi:peptidoglycan/xylan/chitin deacetylase (PgdA/CDA1 family)
MDLTAKLIASADPRGTLGAPVQRGEAMSKRLIVSRLLHRTGALEAILKLRARASTPWLSILTYHRFPQADGEEPFDDGVIDVTRDEFERHVACLKKHFTPIGVDELCAFAAGGRLPRNAVAITFDDGYLDNYEQALPILKRHDCKAIFFVATSIITERRMYWWDRVAYLLKRSARDVIVLRYPTFLSIDLAGDRAQAIDRVLRFIKAREPLDIERLLLELSRATGVLWTREQERDLADRLLMNWDHVRSLQEAGMDVQSHTRTHRVLKTLAPQELADELEGSRADLQRELGEPARALAYPVGNALGSASHIRVALEKAGYEIGLTNGTGPTPLWRPVDRFDMCRQTVGRNVSEAYLLSILAVPPLAPKNPSRHSIAG